VRFFAEAAVRFGILASRSGILVFCCGLTFNLYAVAPQLASEQQPGAVQKPDAAAQAPAPDAAHAGGITEEALKQQLLGKPLYLRGGYLDNSLSFNEHGGLLGHSPRGSYTLSGIEISKVHLTKHKVELEGVRYGLHFVGQLAYEDPAGAVDRVRITPKKKTVRITIDLERVVLPKKKKGKEKDKETDHAANDAAPTAPATTSTQPVTEPPAPNAQSEAEQAQAQAEEAKAEIAAAPPEERPADPGSVTTTLSPAHAAKVLKDALDRIFASGIDDGLVASMPDCWRLYYQAAAAKTDYRPADPAVLRQNTVDKKAKLLSTLEPESNEYAQANAVAGMALYHAVIGADGKPVEIAVGRPIGFGLDENAVEAIRKASFEPAIKGGKPVPVLLDLVVQFRIYSKRTAVSSKQDAAEKQTGPQLPGPFSVQQP